MKKKEGGEEDKEEKDKERRRKGRCNTAIGQGEPSKYLIQFIATFII